MPSSAAPTRQSFSQRFRNGFEAILPKIVLVPSVVMILVAVYGFIGFTILLSFTNSSIMPSYTLVGFDNYRRLWDLPQWWIALKNLGIFGLLYIGISTFLGLMLAIFLDQKIRIEGLLRPIYLYPMALSFIVTGTAWKWFLDPGIGLEKVMHQWGWTSFSFSWLNNNDLAIYAIVIAAVWQSSGFVMAMFLAGLRGVDGEIIKAAEIDGASKVTIYRRIILPQMRPVFLSSFVILAHLAIKSFDLVIALTDRGPGGNTEMPATFMYDYSFTRTSMGIGSASSIIMMLMVFSIIIPYLFAEARKESKS